jgi:hypothetical protein
MQGLSVNLVCLVRPSMAVGAERNEIFVFVFLADFPRHDVVHINVNVTTRGYGASMSGFNEYAASQFRWNGRAITNGGSLRHNVEVTSAARLHRAASSDQRE